MATIVKNGNELRITSCLIYKEIYIIFNNFNKFWSIMQIITTNFLSEVIMKNI